MTTFSGIPLADLLREVQACTLCENLPLGPRPILSAKSSAKILIIGQAPGTKVHASGIPWNDPSGDRLRKWMGLDAEQFYNAKQVAIMPMGFCYPGRGGSGDLLPRPECAPKWHDKILEQLPQVELTLLIGQYAQAYYLNDKYKTLTERVKNWQKFSSEGYFPLVHPSPRNQRWLKNNPWFEQEIIPVLQTQIRGLVGVL
jgi:uracil-DNA glycosylase